MSCGILIPLRCAGMQLHQSFSEQHWSKWQPTQSCSPLLVGGEGVLLFASYRCRAMSSDTMEQLCLHTQGAAVVVSVIVCHCPTCLPRSRI